MSKFKEAHAKVAERLENEAEADGEEALVAEITESGEYCHQVEAEVYEVLKKRKAFKLEVKTFNDTQHNTTIPKVKLEYETAVRNFILERDNAKVVVDPVSEIDRDDLTRSPGGPQGHDGEAQQQVQRQEPHCHEHCWRAGKDEEA